MDAQLLNYLTDYAERGHTMFVGSGAQKISPKPVRINGRFFSKFLLAVALRGLNFPVSAKGEQFAYTEGEGDRGLDGIAIGLGRSLRFDAAELENIVKANRSEQPHILFMQAKLLDEEKDQRIQKNDVELFGMNMLAFLTVSPKDYRKTPTNERVLQLHEVYHGLKAAYTKLGLEFEPIIYMLFGVSRPYEHYSGPANAHEISHRLVQSQVPRARVAPLIWGDQEIINQVHSIGVRSEITLKNVRLVPIPAGPAEAAFLGHVAAETLVDALSGEIAGEKQLLEPFFSDNPRAVLEVSEDTSPGAYGIRRMLRQDQADRLVLGHNGVVMTARKVVPKGDTARITDPQIINGAQSCHAFFDMRWKLRDAFVPLKIIVTTKPEVRDDVIIASNSQALIDTADVLACRASVRSLEREFESVSWHEPRRLWLQRRRNDVLSYPSGEVDEDRTLRPKDLALCFAATLWGHPHTVHGDGKWALNNARDGKIFSADHDPAIYWALGWLIVKGRQWGKCHQPRFNWHVDGGASAYNARYQWLNALWRIVDDQPDDVGDKSLHLSGATKARFDAVIGRLLGSHADTLTTWAGEAVAAGIAVAEPRLKACTDATAASADTLRRKRQTEGI